MLSNFYAEFINENVKISISKHFPCNGIEECFTYLLSPFGVIKCKLAFSQVLVQFTFLVPNSFMELRQRIFALIIFPKEFYDFPGWTVCVLILNPVFWINHILDNFFFLKKFWLDTYFLFTKLQAVLFIPETISYMMYYYMGQFTKIIFFTLSHVTHHK